MDFINLVWYRLRDSNERDNQLFCKRLSRQALRSRQRPHDPCWQRALPIVRKLKLISNYHLVAESGGHDRLEILTPRSQIQLQRPGAALLVMQIPIGLCDCIWMQQAIRAALLH